MIRVLGQTAGHYLHSVLIHFRHLCFQFMRDFFSFHDLKMHFYKKKKIKTQLKVGSECMLTDV